MKNEQSTCLADLIDASLVRQKLGNSAQWARWDQRIHALGLPKRYTTASLNDFPRLFEEYVGKSVYITGPTGSGKTHLMAALARRQVALSISKGSSPDKPVAKFISVVDLISRVKNTFNKSSEETDEDVFQYYANTQWLYLDDFGSHNTTDWTFDLIYRLVDYRWGEMLPMVISSNLSIQELSEAFSSRIASRILGMGPVIAMRPENNFLKHSKV